jgi:uncharacterized protein YbjT (DUF2867 family)
VKVLLVGSGGFIGRHLMAALERHGHTVVEGRRCPRSADGLSDPGRVCVDFARDHDPAAWVPRLAGIDAVINAVGIFTEAGDQTFQAVHTDGPSALFKACVLAGVSRVVQISALGASDPAPVTQYLASKQRADTLLKELPLEWTIVQPSLVFGADGASSRFFLMLASLPVVALPRGGEQLIQPVHVEDLAAGIASLLGRDSGRWRTIPFVGNEPVSLRGYLAALASGLQLRAPRVLPVPLFLAVGAAKVAARIPGSLLTRDSLQMLLKGNTADPEPLRELLGRSPRAPSQFIAQGEGSRLRREVQLRWLLPLLRLSIATVWIFTGIVSLGLYPKEESLALLARSGVPPSLSPLFLYSAAALDLAFGVATLAMRRRRYLWIAQIALILVYTAIISVRMPEFWLHPYGPLLKNLPMLAAIYLLLRIEKR